MKIDEEDWEKRPVCAAGGSRGRVSQKNSFRLKIEAPVYVTLNNASFDRNQSLPPGREIHGEKFLAHWLVFRAGDMRWKFCWMHNRAWSRKNHKGKAATERQENFLTSLRSDSQNCIAVKLATFNSGSNTYISYNFVDGKWDRAGVDRLRFNSRISHNLSKHYLIISFLCQSLCVRESPHPSSAKIVVRDHRHRRIQFGLHIRSKICRSHLNHSFLIREWRMQLVRFFSVTQAISCCSVFFSSLLSSVRHSLILPSTRRIRREDH